MTLEDALAENGLQVVGHVAAEHLVLLGPAGNFWEIFTQSSEYLDGEPDPIDRMMNAVHIRRDNHHPQHPIQPKWKA